MYKWICPYCGAVNWNCPVCYHCGQRWTEEKIMSNPRMIGQFKTYIPNSRADMRRKKRNREYTDKHVCAVEKKLMKKEATE